MSDQQNDDTGISMCFVRHQQSAKISKRFSIHIEGAPPKILYIANNESAAKIARELRLFTSKISPIANVARGQVEDIITRAPTEMLIGVDCQGWHDDVYITQEWKRGARKDSYCYLNEASQGVTQRKGSLKSYRRDVVTPSRQSRYLSSALMMGLTAPMLKFANLSEGAVFHVFGESTTGKTSMGEVGESISRPPRPTPGWDQTQRRLEELAAGHCDQLLVLNAAEKARAKDQAIILHALAHEVSEGDGKGRSKSVQDWLPNLTSRSPVLTTGNLSGHQMARGCGVAWNRQEEMRFISIPVPAAVDGGIIDRPREPQTEEQNRELIERIVAAARENHGVALPPWVMKVYRRRDKIPGFIDEYVQRTGLTDPAQVRVARKFGLVYAAGTIAARCNFMPWTVDFVFDVVNRLMNRALQNVVNDLTPYGAVRALRKATIGKNKLPVLKGRRLDLGDQPIVGFKFDKRGRRLIALRRETLPKLMGLSDSSETIIRMLADAGVIETGHGGKTTQQVPFTQVTARGSEVKSPRMVVVDPEKLSRSRNNE